LDKSLSHRAHPSGFDPDYFARLFAIEDRHFWFRSRNRVISTLAKQITHNLTPGYRVLEVGCGTGNVLRVLEQACTGGMVVGMDPFSEALRCARQRTHCSLVRGDVHALPFRAQFQFIGLFDVLEHLPDDEQVLRDLYGLLAPKGALLLTVPAHPLLWSYFDEASHHVRRYKRAELENKIICAGLTIEYLTPYMASIFPLVWLKRRLSLRFGRRTRKADANRIHNLTATELQITPVLNGLLAFLLGLECPLIARRRHLPIGTSLLAIARKG
jgi:ubiquinone/menaquinone biosynthesis C-methylase UbiE